MEQYIFSEESRSFSSFKVDKFLTKDTAKIIGTAAATTIIPAVIKAIAKTRSSIKTDKLLVSRNERLNQLTDNYNVRGLEAKTDPASVEKYRKQIDALYQETLRLMQAKRDIFEHKDPDLYINVNQDQYGSTRSVSRTPKDKDTVLYNYIDPFIVVLKMILVRGVHVLPGTMLGADRRNFELVFDPEHSNPEDAARNAFRTVLYKHPWPAHGFEVSMVSSTGKLAANTLINGCIDFLANNPKYLAIRV
jgi:hypothetical protein